MSRLFGNLFSLARWRILLWGDWAVWVCFTLLYRPSQITRRADGTHHRRESVHPAVGVFPDLLGLGVTVDLGIDRVLELLEDKALDHAFGEFPGLVKGVFGRYEPGFQDLQGPAWFNVYGSKSVWRTSIKGRGVIDQS